VVKKTVSTPLPVKATGFSRTAAISKGNATLDLWRKTRKVK